MQSFVRKQIMSVKNNSRLRLCNSGILKCQQSLQHKNAIVVMTPTRYSLLF